LDGGNQLLTSPKGNCLPGNCASRKQQVAENAEDLLLCMHEHQEQEEQPIQLKTEQITDSSSFDVHKVNNSTIKDRRNLKKIVYYSVVKNQESKRYI